EVHDSPARAIEASIVPWLFEGTNHLVVSLAPLPPMPGEEPHFRIGLYAKTEAFGLRGNTSLAAEYRYSENESSNVYGVSFSPVFRHAFTFPVRVSWSYQKATPYDPNHKPEVLSVVQAFHAALERKNMPALKQLLALKHTEVALGSETPRDELED